MRGRVAATLLHLRGLLRGQRARVAELAAIRVARCILAVSSLVALACDTSEHVERREHRTYGEEPRTEMCTMRSHAHDIW